MGVSNGRCFGKACACRAKGRAENGGFLGRAPGIHYMFEGGLTKSDLHFKNISWLHLEYGGWISGAQGGCRETNKKLLKQCAEDNDHSD